MQAGNKPIKANNGGNDAAPQRRPQHDWRAKLDPKSGRTYYHNVKTLATTWTKPLELCSESERAEYIAKREATIKFFREMEDNIRRKFAAAAANDEDSWGSNPGSGASSPVKLVGRLSPGTMVTNTVVEMPSGPSRGANRRIRTISSIDDELLDILKFDERRNNIVLETIPDEKYYSIHDFNTDRDRNNSISWCKPPSPEAGVPVPMSLTHAHLRADAKGTTSNIAESKTAKKVISSTSASAKGESKSSNRSKTELDAAAAVQQPKKLVKRRNSTGTIYLESTMSSQNNEATIKCVCVVIRAHMIEGVRSVNDYDNFNEEFEVFNDDYVQPDNSEKRLSISTNKVDFKAIEEPKSHEIPSLDEIVEFFSNIFSKSQLEAECIIIALIYCERLVKNTKGRLSINSKNWRSIVFACLVMASKVWDDLSMWNVDFSQICSNINLQRINTLELAILDALGFVIRVSASEYAKYYFHLRSMMARLDHNDGLPPRNIAPLDIQGARRLEIATDTFQQQHAQIRGGRSHSMHVDPAAPSTTVSTSVGALNSGGGCVGLEQLIHSVHLDADGTEKRDTSTKSTKRNPPSASSKEHKSDQQFTLKQLIFGKDEK